MYLSYTPSGHIYLQSGMDFDRVIDAIIATGYPEEICISDDWSPVFISELMAAGFLVMSMNIAEDGGEPNFIVLPKHHLLRTVLFFDDIHIGKTVKRLLPRYQLAADFNLDTIIQKCIDVHGDEWITPPLVECIKKIHADTRSPVRPFSFGLLHDGKLAAGEFGIIVGNVYTSYSGYYEENSAGRVQMIQTALYLRECGFAFWDLGMPLPYKYTLGAHDTGTASFIRLFRAGREGKACKR
jgi:Leu/Phe-tRNA-protein transferase